MPKVVKLAHFAHTYVVFIVRWRGPAHITTRTTCGGDGRGCARIRCAQKQLSVCECLSTAHIRWCVLRTHASVLNVHAAQYVAEKTYEVIQKHGWENKVAAYVTDTCAVMNMISK